MISRTEAQHLTVAHHQAGQSQSDEEAVSVWVNFCIRLFLNSMHLNRFHFFSGIGIITCFCLFSAIKLREETLLGCSCDQSSSSISLPLSGRSVPLPNYVFIGNINSTCGCNGEIGRAVVNVVLPTHDQLALQSLGISVGKQLAQNQMTIANLDQAIKKLPIRFASKTPAIEKSIGSLKDYTRRIWSVVRASRPRPRHAFPIEHPALPDARTCRSQLTRVERMPGPAGFPGRRGPQGPRGPAGDRSPSRLDSAAPATARAQGANERTPRFVTHTAIFLRRAPMSAQRDFRAQLVYEPAPKSLARQARPCRIRPLPTFCGGGGGDGRGGDGHGGGGMILVGAGAAGPAGASIEVPPGVTGPEVRASGRAHACCSSVLALALEHARVNAQRVCVLRLR